MITPASRPDRALVWSRFVLQLDRTRAYFFWLYIGYFCCEAALAVLSLVWYPPKSQLLLWSPHDEGYLVRLLLHYPRDGMAGVCSRVSLRYNVTTLSC